MYYTLYTDLFILFYMYFSTQTHVHVTFIADAEFVYVHLKGRRVRGSNRLKYVKCIVSSKFAKNKEDRIHIVVL